MLLFIFLFQPITADDLVAAAMHAHSKSTDKDVLKHQKKAAFIEAYRSVDINDRHQIKKYFVDDCELFGYDINNPEVFDDSKPLTLIGAFDWSKPWGDS